MIFACFWSQSAMFDLFKFSNVTSLKDLFFQTGTGLVISLAGAHGPNTTCTVSVASRG